MPTAVVLKVPNTGPKHGQTRRISARSVGDLRKRLKRGLRETTLFRNEAVDATEKRARTERSFLFQHPLLTLEGEDLIFRWLRYLQGRMEYHHRRQLTSVARSRRNLHLRAFNAASRLIEETRDLLVKANLRLASSAARKYVSDVLEFDELFSEASVILLKAIDLFDPERGFRFSTYYINAAMRHLHKVARQRSSRTLDVFAAESDLLAQLATISTDELELEEEILARSQFRQRAEQALSHRHFAVIAMRCGFDGAEGHSFAAIGDDLGVSKERARQLFNEAIDRLREECVETKA